MKVDEKRLKKFEKQLDQLGKTVIQIGAIGDHRPKKKGGKTISNAALLEIHEFGLGNNPPRMPIQVAISQSGNLEELKDTLVNLIRVNFKDQQAGFDIDSIAEGLALKISQQVKATINSRLSPENKEETVRRKRGDLPLVDTRQLINSIEGGYYFG